MQSELLVEELIVKVDEIIAEMEGAENDIFFLALEYADQLLQELLSNQ